MHLSLHDSASAITASSTIKAQDPLALPLWGGPATQVLSGALAIALAAYIALIALIAWRSHRDQDGFDNNLRLLEVLIGALPWRRGSSERRATGRLPGSADGNSAERGSASRDGRRGSE